MHLLRLVALVCLVASSADALALPEDDRVQAEKLVQEGLTDARARRFRDAIAKFEAAFRLYPRAEIQHNLARAHEELKEYKQAHAHFSKALQEDYTFAEDGRKRLAAIEDILRKSHALVTVKATPSQVRVVLRFSDGTEETHTSTPLETWAPAGSFELTASNPRFESLVERRTLAAGSEVTLDMVLKPVARRGFIDIRVSHPGANLTLSGQALGKSPLGATPWNAGTYMLEVSLAGYRPFEQTVSIEPDQVTTLNVELQAVTSSVGDDSGETIPWAGWTLGGLGLAGGVSTVILQFGKALPLERQANTRKNDPDPAVYNRLLDRAYSYETAAIVTGAVSVALLGTGLYLILSHEDEPPSKEATTSFTPTLSLSPDTAYLGGVLRF